MSDIKLVFTTAAVAETPRIAERMIHWLLISCDRLGINLQPYGIGSNYIDWRDIKITKFVAAAKRFKDAGFTHVFYTDGRDSFMLGGEFEIREKYRMLGQPPYLVSCEDQCYPFPEYSHLFPDVGHPWRFIGAGQFICEIDYALDMWQKLERLYSGMPYENHDQGWLERGYVENILDPKEFVLDTGCEIFQCVREGLGKPLSESRLEVEDQRVYNTVTNSCPCAIHFPGGYSDPETGKDHVLGPAWEQIYGALDGVS